MKPSHNLLNPSQRDVTRLRTAPRCSAMSKRTRQPCRAPAVKGWTVCRFHGARGGAPKGNRNGRYSHGEHTEDATAFRREMQALLKEARSTVSELTPVKVAIAGS